jgi:hypothetical protein
MYKFHFLITIVLIAFVEPYRTLNNGITDVFSSLYGKYLEGEICAFNPGKYDNEL